LTEVVRVRTEFPNSQFIEKSYKIAAIDVTPKRGSDASFNGLIRMSGTVDDSNVDIDDKVVRNNAIVGVLA